MARASLDLRPRSVVVTGVPADKDEALAHSLMSSRYSNVDRRSANEVVVTFSDRKAAEQFFNTPNDLPEVGKVEKSWTRSAEETGDASMST